MSLFGEEESDELLSVDELEDELDELELVEESFATFARLRLRFDCRLALIFRLGLDLGILKFFQSLLAFWLYCASWLYWLWFASWLCFASWLRFSSWLTWRSCTETCPLELCALSPVSLIEKQNPTENDRKRSLQSHAK